MKKGTHKIKVRGFHLDLYGHVNNARYLELLEAARWEYYEGEIDYDYFEKNKLAFVIVNISINYKFPATIGDSVRIETSLKNAGGRSIVLKQVCYLNDTDQVVVDADITFVILDQTTMKAIAIEGELREMLV